jgi:hypothetical protein
MPINISIDANDFTRGIEDLDNVEERMLKVSKKLADALTTEFQTKHLDGQRNPFRSARSQVRRRSGDLIDAMEPINPIISGDNLTFGTKNFRRYARVHIAPKGTVTVINKKDKKLAIPLTAAKTPSGVVRGKPRDFQNTFIRKSKAGNLIIFQNESDGIKPLFVLKDQVKVPARVHPEIILERFRSRVNEEVAEAILDA